MSLFSLYVDVDSSFLCLRFLAYFLSLAQNTHNCYVHTDEQNMKHVRQWVVVVWRKRKHIH